MGQPADIDVPRQQLARVAKLIDDTVGLSALWLHGSRAKGLARPDSDVDLAALVRRQPDGPERLAIADKARELLGKAVDIAWLDNNTSPILAFQVLRDGALVADIDLAARLTFTARMLTDYHDLKRVRAASEAALLARMRRAG